MNRSSQIFHPWLAAISVFVLLALSQQAAKGIAIDQSNTYDALNRLSGAGSNGYSYDDAGNMLQITGGVSASLAVLPTSATVPDTARTGLSFAVTASGAWTAASDQGWLTLTTSGGSGNGSVTFNLGLNSTGSLRTAHVTVTSGALTATYTLSQLSPPPPPFFPIVTSLAAVSVTNNSATFSGTSNPNGTLGTAYFEYGEDTGYGTSTTSVGIGGGTAAVPVNINVKGLGGNTIYHYRLVSTNFYGTTNGPDISFITLNGPSNNAKLSNLALSTGTLTPAFASATTGYTASVLNGTSSIAVTPTTAEGTATVKVNGISVASGQTSGLLSLGIGQNLINTVVTAGDGVTMQTYTVVITRQTAVESWRQIWYNTTTNSGIAANAADPYSTGITNLAVFAFFGPNQNPAMAQVSLIPQPQMSGGNLAYSFTQPAGVSGVTFGAEWSGTLQNDWQPVPDTGSGSQHIFSIPMGDTRKFLRLTVSDP